MAAELCLQPDCEQQSTGVSLVVEANRLLVSVGADQPGAAPPARNQLRLDWARLDTVSQAGRSRQQPLLKAVFGKKRVGPHFVVLDCTAGLGEDAWLLASLGCSVIALERNPLCFALVRDAWARIGVERQIEARRFRILHAEALDVLQNLEARQAGKQTKQAGQPELSSLPQPEVVYLDPMFPGHDRRTTAAKKSMRLARAIVGDTQDESELLLGLALKVAKFRVVLKRARKAARLCSKKGFPTHQVQARGFRYDIYLPD